MVRGETKRRALICLAVIGISVVAGAERALAVKWLMTCLPAIAERFKVGHWVYATSLFVHIGHELTLTLKNVDEDEGFSVEPDGNTVVVGIMTPERERITWATFPATAVSPTRPGSGSTNPTISTPSSCRRSWSSRARCTAA